MLDKLELLACEYFKITRYQMRSVKRSEDLYTARHVFRATAVHDYGFKEYEVATFQGVVHGSVYNSVANVIDKKQYQLEYHNFKEYVVKKLNSKESVATDGVIERITNEAFDERFYKHPEKVNIRTGNNYFPAFHFITSLGAPENDGLGKWKQDKGHFADTILVRSAAIGTFVHDSIDGMLKKGIAVKHDTIHQMFPDEKEAQRVKECLLGFINFMADQEPEIVSSEMMVVADDFAFTMDLQCKIKEDGYKSLWVVDWKTSKVATEEHKMQVEVMRRVTKADKAAIVVLGNGTKKGYTFSPVQPSKADYLWKRFCAIRETAYVEILERGLIKPRENNMPDEFSLKNVNYKKV